MKNIKKVCLMLVVISMVVSLFAGCGSSTASTATADTKAAVQTKDAGTAQDAQKPVKEVKMQEYAFILSLSQLEFFNDPKKGLQDAAKELGNVKVTVAGPTELDPQAVNRAIEENVAKKVDGILVWGQFPGQTDSAIDKAIDSGMPVVCIGADIPGSKRLTCIGGEQYTSGIMFADLVAKAINGKGKVATMNTVSAGAKQAIDRAKGFEETIKAKYPNIQIVEVLDDKADPVLAPTVAASCLQKHPDLACFVGLDAVSGVGAATAIREAGQKGKIKIVAGDRDEGTLDLIESGEIEATVVQKSYIEGYWGLKMIYAYKNGLLNGMFASEEQMKGSKVIPLPYYCNTGFAYIDKGALKSWRH